MLQLIVPPRELWDERAEEFVYSKKHVLQLEHSLVSLSKWESKWCKPFLAKSEKTDEEILDYIRCMTINQNVSQEAYAYMTEQNVEDIYAYIEAPMTATHVEKLQKDDGPHDTVTSELIYYWMIAFGIPFECQKWHLNRLLALIEVCEFKNSPPKKMSAQEIFDRNRALNEKRRNKWNSKG